MGQPPEYRQPQLRFTPEFGMESEWGHNAMLTRKAVGCHHPEDCIEAREISQSRNQYLWWSSPRSISISRLHTLLHFHH